MTKCTVDPRLTSNRTLTILREAESAHYGVLAQVCYDTNSVLALIRAAERSRSPGIVQLFPVTLAYQDGGGPLLAFCLEAAKRAKVPIAVHLDHATDPEHLEIVLRLAEDGLKFDSVMVDASHAETDEANIALTRPYVERLHAHGIAVEVEMGRLEGGEAGLRMMNDSKLTDPSKALAFVDGTGASILAPSIGNLHGLYLKPPAFRQDILKSLHEQFIGSTLLCLHGTDELPDNIFIECIQNGVSKINVNSWARDPYVAALASRLRDKSFPEAVDDAIVGKIPVRL